MDALISNPMISLIRAFAAIVMSNTGARELRYTDDVLRSRHPYVGSYWAPVVIEPSNQKPGPMMRPEDCALADSSTLSVV